MSPVVAYLIVAGVAILLGTFLVEWFDGRARWERFEEWERLRAARDVTGRVGGPQRWEP